MFYICSPHDKESIGLRKEVGERKGKEDRASTAENRWRRQNDHHDHVEGAKLDDVVRGLLAAQAVLDKAGITADQAATARFIVEGWDIKGFPYPAPEAELAICGVWYGTRPTKRP